MRTRLVVMAGLALLGAASCKRPETGPAPAASATFTPAPQSSLARELGCDDAGRGQWSYMDGPGCGKPPRIDRACALGAGITRETPALMAAAPVTPLGFFATETPPSQGPGGTGALRLTLSRRGAGVATRGAPIELALALQNATEDDLVLATAIDGSLEHMRSPFVDLYARETSSGQTYRWAPGPGYGRCGNVNPRTKADWVRVPPGARVPRPLGPWADHVERVAIDAPGTFMLWVVYAACLGPERGAALGQDEAAPPGAFEGTLASNPVTIEIR